MSDLGDKIKSIINDDRTILGNHDNDSSKWEELPIATPPAILCLSMCCQQEECII